jgi:hypothetical protein
MRFNDKLVLNQYIFSLFGCESFEDFLKQESSIKDTNLEKIDEEGISLYYHLMTSRFFTNLKIDKIKLLEYDNNIVRHTKELKREIKWKYFQYLTLLFTEIYLDMYFSSRESLLKNLNTFLKEFNNTLPAKSKERLEPFKYENLNKLAFWNATGSGKTLLMHINILQFKHYNKDSHHKINKTILITPNSGLSAQHLKEFKESGLEAEIFKKDGNNLFTGDAIEIIEIHKLKDEEKETTVAVDSFGDDNLVFIDEAHRGSGGEEWKTNRDKLSAEGFAFEYSATFGQAVNSATGANKKNLVQEYSKSILFDYSYKYFYEDGFGKDYTILNLKEDPSETIKYNYLVGALLSFYQQKKIFEQNGSKMKEYNIHNPLMVFVGGKVSQSISKAEGSDITNVLKFFQKFIDDKQQSVQAIQNILEYQSGINTTSGVDIFTSGFDYLSYTFKALDPDSIYDDILHSIFHGSNGTLHLDELKGQEGEIGLKVGDGDYFGVINIGITSDFKKLCEKQDLDLTTKDFSHSLFHGINKNDSKINFLIGSRKFSEGWSSWRVSSMGLLNMGKSEGAQVIQLFGRGVRLKGKSMSLKRSTVYGKTLETKYTKIEQLNIFGLKANYMDEFRKYLQNEGVPSGEMLDFELPTIRDNSYKGKKLKVLRVREDKDFKKDVKRDLVLDTRDAITKKVIVNYYAKAQVIGIVASNDYITKPYTYTFTAKDLALVDFDKVLLELIRYKNERNYFNLNIDKSNLKEFAKSGYWYMLEVPKEYFKITKFEDYKKVEDVFISLLKKYCDEFYKYHKQTYEKDFLVYKEIEEDDSNFVDNYKVSIEDNSENSNMIERIKHLAEDLKKGVTPKNIDIGYFKSFVSNQHMYNPLLFKNARARKIKISPIELNEGEIKFVEDLEDYLSQNPIENTEIFLLRNRSKSGIGFFEEGGFYPDFILWVLKDGIQYINFCDPKGIRNLNPKTDPKINFHTSLKEKEAKLADSSIVLNSFIISNTPFSAIYDLHSDISKVEMDSKHVLFQDESRYIEALFRKIL